MVIRTPLTPNIRFINEALQAGRTYRGHTWPNPSVGCVLVKDGEVIATGCTQPGGRPHAEMDALAKAGDAARGCIAYVTLEPCNHASDGKPVSCCDGLIAAGVAGVVIGMPDPDPRMAGRSIQKFRDLAIPVDVGTGIESVIHAHLGHCMRITHDRPRVTLKLAHSTDKKIGIAGERTPISGDVSWDRTFLLRSKVDAVVIGIGTALTDNPLLTDRRKGVTQQPIRIVVDRGGRLPLTSKLVQGLDDAPVWILCAPGADTTALENIGVRAIPCPAPHGKIDMKAALKILGDIGLTHILAEGGATLATDLLQNNLVDEAVIIEGTKDLGANGIPMPAFDLVLREEYKAGSDTWRIYDSKDALEFMRGIFLTSQKLQAG